MICTPIFLLRQSPLHSRSSGLGCHVPLLAQIKLIPKIGCHVPLLAQIELIQRVGSHLWTQW